MRKYLMTGVAAIALAAAFTSCSKSTDLYVEGAKEAAEAAKKTETVQTNYNEAFESVFGKPAENQDWGLAEYGTPKALSRAMTRSFTPTHLSGESSWTGWASAPAASDYITEMPSDAVEFSSAAYGQGTELKKYYLSETTETQAPNVWMGNFQFYITGTKKMKFRHDNEINT